MQALFSTIQVVICVILVLLILMHSGKDSGLSGAFGVGTGTARSAAARWSSATSTAGRSSSRSCSSANTILLLKHPWGGTG